MSTENLLKHIYTFINTLSIANTQQVVKWGSRNLQNAFNWAKYAEELHSKLKERPFRDELDGKIQDMSVHLSPVSSLQLDFNKLGNASEILFWTLIQNPHLPEELTQELFLSYDSQLDIFYFKMGVKFAACVSDITTLTVGQDILSSCLTENDTLLDNVNSQAKCLYHTLSRVIFRLHLPQDTSKIDTYITTLTERLCGMKHGLAIILSLYLQTGFSEDPKIQNISSSLFHFIRHKSSLPLETVPKVLLLQLCNADFKFVEIFLDWLISSARAFVIKYPEDELYIWTCPDLQTTCISFNDLKTYFSLLLNVTKVNKSNVVKERLEQCSKESFVNVFKDILRSLE